MKDPRRIIDSPLSASDNDNTKLGIDGKCCLQRALCLVLPIGNYEKKLCRAMAYLKDKYYIIVVWTIFGNVEGNDSFDVMEVIS